MKQEILVVRLRTPKNKKQQQELTTAFLSIKKMIKSLSVEVIR